MKLKNPISGMQILFPGAASILLAALLLLACNKNNEAPPPNTSDMTAAAKAVDGKLAQGKITSISDAEGLLMHINDLDIIVSKVPGGAFSTLPDISSAAVITSKHGLIVKDLAQGHVYFLVNNDEESIRQFNAIASLFPSTVKNNLIFGTTVVQSSNS